MAFAIYVPTLDHNLMQLQQKVGGVQLSPKGNDERACAQK